MSSEHHKISISNKSMIDITVLSSGSSLMDMLTQQPHQTTGAGDPSSVTSGDDTKDQPILASKNNDNTTDQAKLTTLFNTTGRERNSTGPLKEWLYEHRDHPYPDENDKQELMKKTNMSAAQITIWFTNARVKMRKENELQSNLHREKKKQKPLDDSNHSKETLELTTLFTNDIFQLIADPVVQPNEKRIVMAYSCLNSEQITNLRHLVSMHPDQLSISDHVDDHTTHLIIGNEVNPLLCPLTKKLFQSIARHLYIITYRWIIECLKQNDIIDESNYEIRGDIPFGEHHDGMRNSRLSKEVKLFQSYQFFILCNGCQDKMSETELASLIQLCHGSLLDKFPLTTYTENSMSTIVLCNELPPFKSSNQQQLFELSRSNGVHFLNPEWILESIVHFAVQPFDFYEEKF